MDDLSRQRLFGYQHAFDQPIVMWMAIGVGVLLLATPIVVLGLARLGALSSELRTEVIKRALAWGVMAPLVIVPILLGAAPTIIMVTIISLLCYREFARATGLFRDKPMSAMVVIGIVATGLSTLDHWYGLFVAVPPLFIVLIAAVAVFRDQPKGFIQRVGLSSLAMLLFGTCLGHAAYLANDANYRPMLLLLLLAIGLNDIFAFCVGKTFKGPKLAPNTSPGKTVSGAVGAVVLTSTLVFLLAGFVFQGGPLEHPLHRLTLGLILAVAGILGDLTISSVKRDVGVKDMGALIPGHGGVLDRCNSLLLASPAMFHFVGYHAGIGLKEPTRVLTTWLGLAP